MKTIVEKFQRQVSGGYKHFGGGNERERNRGHRRKIKFRMISLPGVGLCRERRSEIHISHEYNPYKLF